MPFVMCLFYFIYTFILSSLAVSVGVMKDQGVATTPHNDAVNGLASFFMILAASIWYLGWLGGVIAFAFHLLSLPHSTYGWLMSVPSALRFKRSASGGDYYAVLANVRQHATRMESWFLILTIAYFIFLVSSFFIVPFGSFRSWWTLPRILVFAGICAVGFIARIIVGPKLQADLPSEDDFVSY